MTCFVYHICHEKDKYDFSKGYIGITGTPEYRWMRHKQYEKTGRLFRIYQKYSDIIEYVLVEGSREYCAYLESKLRPTKRIGWNLVEGGGDPPSHSGKVMSQSQKDKIGLANSGVNGPGWKGWWVVNGIEYDSKDKAARANNVTRATVKNRTHNPNFPNWTFKESKR